MGQSEKSNVGKGAAFFSGFVVGGALGAVVLYLTAAPSGKEVIHRLQQESVLLKGKSVEIIETAKQRSIDLTHKISTAKKDSIEEKEQMIPIPKDY
ncbi:YtxH domain-containing protein [Sporolactobacillus nakayamae]|uniref:YtxH-like protein n=1 Tax=Sporolactobacillus nakayamae TaxID=269670 RepID=A0A1I2RQ93_9BACL|nr:YtxH domain-containing protein [Sporolactobacillus nakayamae]SFG42692.1 YtxH-like protein [Sporolactobacillus nakayamae]